MEEHDLLDVDFDENNKRYSLASHGKRFLNFFVDAIILSIITNVVNSIISSLFVIDTYDPIVNDFSEMQSQIITVGILSIIISILIQVYFYTILEYNLKGKTIAKYLTNTKVLSEDYTEPTFKQIHIRSWCRLIPFEPFSFLGSKPKGWHDSISKTIVVDESKLK